MDMKKGSFTIEMSLLMCFVMLSLAFVIYICCYVHNEVNLKAKAYEIALAGSLGEISSKDEGKRLVEERFTQIDT